MLILERGAWSVHSGWYFGSNLQTSRILDTLAKRRLVAHRPKEDRGFGYGEYTITEAGIEACGPEAARRAERAAEASRRNAEYRAEQAAKKAHQEETRRQCEATLEKLRPLLAELGIHPDTVVIGEHEERIGILLPAEAAETLTEYAIGAPI